MEITHEELEKIVTDLMSLSERKNLNKQLKESAAKAADLVKGAADILAGITPEQQERILKMTIGEEPNTAGTEQQEPEYVYVTVIIQGAPPQKIWMDRHSAENMAASFRQYNKPTFACNLPNMHMQFGGLWEVDLRQVACITSDHLKLVEIEKPEEQEEEDRPVSSYKNRSRSQGWRRGNVTCHNCGADYETDINEKWAYVKCKYCHESDTTVTYDN